MLDWRFKFCILALQLLQCGNAQYYSMPPDKAYDQNGTLLPYPYQGPNPVQGMDMGIPSPGAPAPYPYTNNQVMTNTNQLNGYYALLAQQGRPAYQYPGIGYSYGGYPAFPQQYLPQGFGYPQLGMGYPPVGYGQPGAGYPQQTAQEPRKQETEMNGNIRTEILDVSPEYQRQILGWPAENPSEQGGNCVGSHCNQGSNLHKPRYTVNVNSQTSNETIIPTNLTKPIVTEKKFVTSIRRTFVYDSSKPEKFKPINLHIINGQPVTTTAPPETTVNEDVEENNSTSTFKPSGRRFMDVPKSCPKGSMIAHNGECIAPFTFRNPTNNATTIQDNVTKSKRNCPIIPDCF